MALVHQSERLNTQPAHTRSVQAIKANASPVTAWAFGVDSRRHADAWREIMRQLGFSVSELPSPDEGGASALCLTSPLGVEFVLIEAADQLISASALAEPRTTWMAILIGGRTSLVADQRVEAMSPGDIAYGPGGQPSAVRLEARCRLMFVRAPHIVTDIQAEAPYGPDVSRLGTATSGGRILSGLLRATANVLGDLTALQLRPVELALAEFFTLWSVEHQGEELGGRAHRRRLRQTIESSMPDPGLSLRRLANSEGVSPRYVQRLFGAKGETFSGYLRARRLERCRLELRSPTHVAQSIFEIYSRWGFKSGVQFSRAYRKHFGVSPRQDRRAPN